MTRRERWKLDDGNSIQVWFKEKYYQVLCVARTQWGYPDQAMNAEFREVTKDIGKRVVDLLNGDAPTWTGEKPTVPGFYWYRDNGQIDIVVVKKVEWGWYATGLNSLALYSTGNLDHWTGQWSGPIRLPEEAK